MKEIAERILKEPDNAFCNAVIHVMHWPRNERGDTWGKRDLCDFIEQTVPEYELDQWFFTNSMVVPEGYMFRYKVRLFVSHIFCNIDEIKKEFNQLFTCTKKN